MVDKDVSRKLGTVDDWVVTEFARLDEQLPSRGLTWRDVGGPGREYRLNEHRVVEFPPKRRFLGVGLPKGLSEDVAAHRWVAWPDREGLVQLPEHGVRSRHPRTTH